MNLLRKHKHLISTTSSMFMLTMLTMLFMASYGYAGAGTDGAEISGLDKILTDGATLVGFIKTNAVAIFVAMAGIFLAIMAYKGIRRVISAA
jgi:hypothetical protein